MPRLPGFIGGSYKSQSIVAADDQCINLIPAKIESGTGAAPWVFDPAPGYAEAGITGDGACRASLSLNQVGYMVLGDYLTEVVAYPTPSHSNLVNIGGAGPCSIAANGVGGNQVMVTNGGGDLFWYNTVSLTSGQIVTLPADVDRVVFMDGYFIALCPDTNSIYFSALNDGTSWDPLDVAARTDYPDRWIAMIVRSTDLILIGQENTSIYYNDGVSDPPFVPNRNIAIQRGIRSRYSLCLLQGNPVWLADDGTVRYMQGYSPARVSNHALEYAISQYLVTDTSDGDTYVEQGHSIYRLNFADASEAGESWGWDLSSGQWHQLGPYDDETDAFGVLPVIHAMYLDSLAENQLHDQLVGSRVDGKVYFQSQTYTTEIDGTTGITRRRRAPVLVNELKNIIHYNFQLMLEVGTANAAPPGDDPMVLLQYSDNGGQTFNTGEEMSAGLHNEFDKRVIWRKLGIARNRVYQVTMDAPIQWRLVDAFINQSLGAS